LFDFPDHSGQDSEDTALSQNGCQITCLHSDQADILPLLKMILAEAHRHEPASEQICQYLLNAFLLKIGRVTNSQFSAGSVPDISGECAQIKDYIDHHYSEEVTLSSEQILPVPYFFKVLRSCPDQLSVGTAYLKQQRAFEKYRLQHYPYRSYDRIFVCKLLFPVV